VAKMRYPNIRKQLRFLAENIEEAFAGIAFVIMVAVTVVNVMFRLIIGQSFINAEEIAYIGFAYSICLGVVVLFKHNAMIAIEVVVDHLPKKAQKIIRIFNYILLFAINLVLARIGVDFAMKAWTRPMTALRIPYTFIDSAIPISFGLMTFYSARFLYMMFRGDKIEEARLEDQR
jgi:TRAP-type C4-dicarboxylate transport system permease small subunit